MPEMTDKERFVSIFREKIKREGSEDLLNFLLSESSDFFTAPASTRYHGAEAGGLCRHSLNVYDCLCDQLARPRMKNLYGIHYSEESIAISALLHDLCKTTEMISDETGSVSDYSADGLLIGHLVRGVARIEEAAKNVGVSGEIVLLLEHMVLSHHSIPEYGSPKAPMFPEAEVLARIDDLDAKMNEMQGILSRVPEGAFSEKVWSLDRRIYHPKYQEIDGAE